MVGHPGAPLGGVRALSFDLFGTLINYDIRRDELAFVERKLREATLDHEPEHVLKRWLDASLRIRGSQERFHAVRDALAQGLDLVFAELGIREDATEWSRGLLDVWVRLAPHADAVECLRALSQWPKCVLSNYDEANLRMHLELSGLAPHFRFALSSEAARCYKPSPAIFLQAVERLGFAPGEVLHVGDSALEDVAGAKRAGLRACFVDRKGKGIPPGGPEGPDMIIRSLAELPAALAPSGSSEQSGNRPQRPHGF